VLRMCPRLMKEENVCELELAAARALRRSVVGAALAAKRTQRKAVGSWAKNLKGCRPDSRGEAITSATRGRCFAVSAAALRPARASPAGHRRSMARSAAACMGALGSGAPRGNKNALKLGRYTREAIAERAHIRELVRQARKLLLQIE
jgi:hypothetical protein